MLELHEANGAFAALEAYLVSEGFWGRSGVVADLYLGYGLSAALRRTTAPQPPEPCRLPLLACRIRPDGRTPQVTTRHLPRVRRVGADMGRRGVRGRDRDGARGDRARRRLPGQPRAAPLGAVRR